MNEEPENVREARWQFGDALKKYANALCDENKQKDDVVHRQFAMPLTGDNLAVCLLGVGPHDKVAEQYNTGDVRRQRDELRDLCVLLFDAVKYGNQVVDLPGIWNKAKEVLNRTDPEDKP